MHNVYIVSLPCGSTREFPNLRRAKKWGRANAFIFMLWAEKA